MISRVQLHHFYQMIWLKTLLKSNGLTDEFLVNWSKVNYILKSQTLTFWSNSNAKDHNSSKHVKIWNLFIKKSKSQDFILKSQSFLRKFSKCLKLHVFSQLWAKFPHDAIGFKENIWHEICSPPQNLQLWFTKFSQKMLGSQVMILWIRVHETFNLVKFCPSLGRILTYLHGNFSPSSNWNIKMHFKYGL